jgi:serine/threonine protein kinase
MERPMDGGDVDVIVRREPICGFCPAGHEGGMDQVMVVQECCYASRGDETSRIVVQQNGVKHGTDGNRNSVMRSRLLVEHHHLSFHDYYEVGRKLGEGSFGDVHEAFSRPINRDTGRPKEMHPEGDVAAGGRFPGALGVAACGLGRSSGFPSFLEDKRREVAVKVFHIVKQIDEATPRTRQQDMKKHVSFEAERSMLAQLEHPNIVRMYESFKENETLYIVLEVCRGGELYSRLVQHVKEAGGGGLGEPLARTLFRQMLYAVNYLHSKRIVHRDIKTENFLLLSEVGTADQDVLKLCDFGTSARLSDRRPRSMENIGTLSYTAPEVYENKGADVCADCWSLGVVLYVLLTGTNPFRLPGKSSREDVVMRIKTGAFETRRKSWQRLSQAAQDLVKHLLVLDESKRFTCLQALRHKWTIADKPAVTLTPPPSPRTPQQSFLQDHIPKVVGLLFRLPRLATPQRLALTACALTASEADLDPRVPWRDVFMALDTNMDGCLTFEEFSSGIKKFMGPYARLDTNRLEGCFEALDLDCSGTIDWAEWVAVALLSSGTFWESPEPISTAFRLLNRPTLRAVTGADELCVGEMLRLWEPPLQKGYFGGSSRSGTPTGSRSMTPQGSRQLTPRREGTPPLNSVPPARSPRFTPRGRSELGTPRAGEFSSNKVPLLNLGAMNAGEVRGNPQDREQSPCFGGASLSPRLYGRQQSGRQSATVTPNGPRDEVFIQADLQKVLGSLQAPGHDTM